VGVAITVRVPPRHLYQCLDCKRQFTATTGTVFHGSHLALHKWFQAAALLADDGRGIPATELQRRLGIAYKSAWHLRRRIREATQEEDALLRCVLDAMRGRSPQGSNSTLSARPADEEQAF
jgi:transposase-like protein